MILVDGEVASNVDSLQVERNRVNDSWWDASILVGCIYICYIDIYK